VKQITTLKWLHKKRVGKRLQSLAFVRQELIQWNLISGGIYRKKSQLQVWKNWFKWLFCATNWDQIDIFTVHMYVPNYIYNFKNIREHLLADTDL
jgi:hypothetical protein